MAKKTTTNEKDSDKKEEIEEMDEELFSSDIEEEYPDINTEVKVDLPEDSLKEGITIEEEEEFKELPEEEEKFYKYMNVNIKKIKDNDYELIIEGQTHGFCNIFVKHLLKVEGIGAAAYKSTTIEPSKIFIRTQNGYDVKDLIAKGLALLEKEVIKLQKLFHKNF
jgi:DNA-directed RNA polymerase subunit L